MLSLRILLQCVRKAALPKPDHVLRNFPITTVQEKSKSVSKVLLFSSDELRRDPAPALLLQDQEMMLCEKCAEWYHLVCVGITEEEAHAAVDWRCGYCRALPDADGGRAWELPIPQGQRKRLKVAPARNDNATPKARGVQPFDDEVVYDGPSSWEECVELARDGARKINLAEANNKKKAMRLVNEGGHHVVDEVSLGGVRARGVDGALVDDLIGAGLLVEDDDAGEPLEDEDQDD